jgi:multiple antibiotic resistance protein
MLQMDFEKLIRDAIILWATIDPISTALIFIAVTARLTDEQRRRVAARAILYALGILLISIIIGQVLLSAMGIGMVAFQVAGGAVLFLFALRLIFGELVDGDWEKREAREEVAVFPLAVPTIATPGAILAVIVLTDNHLYPITTQIGTAAMTVLILGITYLMMRAARRILNVIGEQGAEMLVRVMGLVLAALSVQLIFDAIGFHGLAP